MWRAWSTRGSRSAWERRGRLLKLEVGAGSTTSDWQQVKGNPPGCDLSFKHFPLVHYFPTCKLSWDLGLSDLHLICLEYGGHQIPTIKRGGVIPDAYGGQASDIDERRGQGQERSCDLQGNCCCPQPQGLGDCWEWWGLWQSRQCSFK